MGIIKTGEETTMKLGRLFKRNFREFWGKCIVIFRKVLRKFCRNREKNLKQFQENLTHINEIL